ncbi:MAG: GGDEF domain-containing protein [Pseudohongiellaceae bacterium]
MSKPAVSNNNFLPLPADPAPATHPDTRRDAVTGLLGEDYFCERLDQLLAARNQPGTPITLALLQLENFYEIRSWVGKSEADLLLGDIARLLKKTLPKKSPVCRCRNNEFAVLLIGDSSRRAALIGEKIRLAAQQLAGHAIPPQLTLVCGVGFGVVDSLSSDAAVLFARARHNLSRRQGQQLRALPGEMPHGLDTAGLLAALQTAIVEQLLQLRFQAIISLDPPWRRHYELCLQLPLPDRVLSAAEFMDVAQQYALGEALDRWVIERALGLLESDLEWLLTVNLTQNSLTSRNFLAWLKTRLAFRPSLASRLRLQISEVDLLIAQHHLPEFSEGLAQLKIGMGISHFGCTSNPLRYLSLLQPAFVKLDGGLLDAAELDLSARQQLEKLVGDIVLTGLPVIAARLEKLRVVSWLWRAGVRHFQGYAIHYPAAEPDYPFVEEIRLG